MGAKFLGAALVGSVAWYAWHWHSYGLTLGSILLRVVVVSFAAATVGKLVGLITSRFQWV